MDEQLVAVPVHAADLEKVLAEFPGDVTAAAAQALSNGGVIQVPGDPAAEPWPSIRVGVGL